MAVANNLPNTLAAIQIVCKELLVVSIDAAIAAKQMNLSAMLASKAQKKTWKTRATQ